MGTGRVLETRMSATHLLCIMTHLTVDPHTFRKEHPGLFRFGEASFFTVVVLALAGLAIAFGAYFVAENALQGLADMARAVS